MYDVGCEMYEVSRDGQSGETGGAGRTEGG